MLDDFDNISQSESGRRRLDNSEQFEDQLIKKALDEYNLIIGTQINETEYSTNQTGWDEMS